MAVAAGRRPPAEHLAHLRTAAGGGGPSRAQPLGRRPGVRQAHEPGRHPRRAVDPVPDARLAARREPPGDAVADPLATAITTQPTQLARTLTCDLGHEVAQHHRSPSPPGCGSTSATPSHLGSAAATRTPTVCCASTCPDAWTSGPEAQADLDEIAQE